MRTDYLLYLAVPSVTCLSIQRRVRLDVRTLSASACSATSCFKGFGWLGSGLWHSLSALFYLLDVSFRAAGGLNSPNKDSAKSPSLLEPSIIICRYFILIFQIPLFFFFLFFFSDEKAPGTHLQCGGTMPVSRMWLLKGQSTIRSWRAHHWEYLVSLSL